MHICFIKPDVMKLLLLFCICSMLLSFYFNVQLCKHTQGCTVTKADTVPKNKTSETSCGAGSENPFTISALIPHWE
jgi:zona occludens toxin (predicted ATPase)